MKKKTNWPVIAGVVFIVSFIGFMVWSSSGNGVDIFASDGILIGKINTPKGAANLCFGGADGRTLFITARDALYAVQTRVTGATGR